MGATEDEAAGVGSTEPAKERRRRLGRRRSGAPRRPARPGGI